MKIMKLELQQRIQARVLCCWNPGKIFLIKKVEKNTSKSKLIFPQDTVSSPGPLLLF